MKKKSLLGVLSALACAFALVLASVTPALAADAPTGSITITSDANSKSDLYQIITTEWDGNADHAPVYKWAPSVGKWLAESSDTTYQSYVEKRETGTDPQGNKTYEYIVTDKFNVADTGKKVAGNPVLTDDKNAAAQFFGALSAAIAKGDPNLTAAQTGIVDKGTASDLSYGSYLIVTTNKDGQDANKESIRVYNPTVVNLGPAKNDQDKWTAETSQNVNVTIKSNVPTISKSQQVDGKSGSTADTIGVGKTVTYTLKATVPSYPTAWTGDKKFIITDTMSKGLTFDGADQVTIIAGTANTDVKSLFTIASSTDQNTGVTTTTFTANPNTYAQLDAYANQTVTVTYKATVNKDAVVNTPMTNGADLTYGHDFKVESTEVKLYTFGIDVFKHEKDQAAGLSGAEFDLYATDANGNATGDPIKFSKNDTGYYYDANGTAKLTTDANGKLRVYGVDAGTYALRETAAPNGYQLLQQDIKVVVTAATDENGAPTGDVTVGQNVTHDAGYVSVDVPNTKGFSLPTTGGSGTLLMTAAGVVLLGGAALLVMRKGRQ